MMREGLRLLLGQRPDLEVAGECGTSEAALAAVKREKPHLILLDLQLGRESGLELLPQLLGLSPSSRVIVLTASDNPRDYRRAFQNGARGVVLKDQASAALLRAIDRVAGGEVWMDAATLASIVAEPEPDHAPPVTPGPTSRQDTEQLLSDLAKVTAPDASTTRTPADAHLSETSPVALSEREREVVALVAEGLKNQEIANRLFVTERTVRYHLNCIFHKLDISDRSKLLVYAYRHGLTSSKGTPAPEVQQ